MRRRRSDQQTQWFSPLLDVAMNGFGLAIVFLIILILLIGRRLTEEVVPERLQFLDVREPVVVLAGQSFVYALPVTGGSGVREFESVNRPEWLVLDPRSGTLSGVAPSPAVDRDPHESVIFEASVRDTTGSDTITVRLDLFGVAVPYDMVANPLVLERERTSLSRAREGQSYREVLAARGGVEPLLWELDPAAAPPGLECKEGILKGTPTVAGTFEFMVRVSHTENEFTYRDVPYRWAAEHAERRFSLEVLPKVAPAIVAPVARVGEPTAITLDTGALAAGERVNWTSAIAGLRTALDGSALIGTPSTAGSTRVAYEILNADGSSTGLNGAADVIVLPSLEPFMLGAATFQSWLGEELTIDVPYRGALEPVRIIEHKLPTGVTIVGNRIVGTPDAVGLHTIELRLEDATGRIIDGTLKLRVGPRF